MRTAKLSMGVLCLIVCFQHQNISIHACLIIRITMKSIGLQSTKLSMKTKFGTIQVADQWVKAYKTFYPYTFVSVRSKYEYLPERRVTATLVVCVKTSIFTQQFFPVFQPVRSVRTVVQSASVSHHFIEIFTRNSRRTTLYGLGVLRMRTAKLSMGVLVSVGNQECY